MKIVTIEDALATIREYFDGADADDLARCYSEIVGEAVVVGNSDVFHSGHRIENLDDMDEDDLEAFAYNSENPFELRVFATDKAKARRYRLAGNIGEAHLQETLLETYYRQLPAKYRW